MGRRGTPPLPTAVAKLRGTNRWKEPPGKEPEVAGVIASTIPDSLRSQRYARECWERMHPVLLQMKVLTKADLLPLEGLCTAYHRARMADRAVKKFGLIIEVQERRGGKSYVTALQANPAVRISQAAWGEVRKFAQEFGLTPSSRTRVREAPDGVRPAGAAEPQAMGTAEDYLFGKKDGTSGRVAGHIGSH